MGVRGYLASPPAANRARCAMHQGVAVTHSAAVDAQQGIERAHPEQCRADENYPDESDAKRHKRAVLQRCGVQQQDAAHKGTNTRITRSYVSGAHGRNLSLRY